VLIGGPRLRAPLPVEIEPRWRPREDLKYRPLAVPLTGRRFEGTKSCLVVVRLMNAGEDVACVQRWELDDFAAIASLRK